jgi:hypothetical protein
MFYRFLVRDAGKVAPGSLLYIIIPSTLHQCLKYIKTDKEKRIDGNVKQFQEISIVTNLTLYVQVRWHV